MLNPKIVVVSSQIEGRGLVAQYLIKKGELVWQLDQNEHRLTKEELLELPDDLQKLAYQEGNEFIIVTDKSEYFNHSCDPNTWWSGDDMLIARRNIQPGEEVTYDYASSDIDPETFPGFTCNCGSPLCRKFVSYKDCLLPEFYKRYSGHLPSWVKNFIQSHHTKIRQSGCE